MSVHIRQLYAIIKIQNKRIYHIKTNNGDDEPLDSGDEKNVLNIPNREKPALTCQEQGSVKSTKGGVLLLKPPQGILYLQTIRNIHVWSRAAILSLVVLNDLEENLELDSHADTSCLGECALIFADDESPVHVQSCDPTLGTKTYCTISGALLYDNPSTGQTYHIVIQQAVEIPD